MKQRLALHGRDHGHGGSDPVLLAWEEVGGGGASRTGAQYLSGNGVSIASGAQDYMTFDNDAGPDALVDASGANLSAPAFLAQGMYAVHVVVQGSSLSSGAGFSMELNMTAISGSYLVDSTVLASAAATTSPRGALTLIGKIGPDAAPTSLGVVTVRVGNFDSVSRFFGLGSAWIQRIA